jgi:hypothetical protein
MMKISLQLQQSNFSNEPGLEGFFLFLISPVLDLRQEIWEQEQTLLPHLPKWQMKLAQETRFEVWQLLGIVTVGQTKICTLPRLWQSDMPDLHHFALI